MNIFIESEHLEYKREISNSTAFAKEVIAFANTRGGRLGIGVDSKRGEVIGIEYAQIHEERVCNIIHDLCTPLVSFTVQFESCGDKIILYIDVPEGVAKPYYLKSEGLENGTYVRVGSTTRKADRETLARLVRQGSNKSYDSETLTSPTDLNEDFFRMYLQKREIRLGSAGLKFTKELLIDLQLESSKGPTVAGALLFSTSPQNVPELSQAIIRAARFRGTNKGEFIDQRDIAGTLPQQIEDAVHFVLKNIRLRGHINRTQRTDFFEYPEKIVRELIVNAVIHRDYSISGESIMLAIYDDRLVITTPGGLTGPVTVQNIADRQFNRNPVLAKRMFEMGYLESWGQGIDLILEWAKKMSKAMPEFKDESSSFSVTIFPEKNESVSGMDKEFLQVKEILLEEKKLTNRLLREELKITKTQAQVLLRRMCSQKLLVQNGLGRSIYYTTPED